MLKSTSPLYLPLFPFQSSSGTVDPSPLNGSSFCPKELEWADKPYVTHQITIVPDLNKYPAQQTHF